MAAHFYLLKRTGCSQLKIQSQTVSTGQLCMTLQYKVGAKKRLMKLTPEVNFINMITRSLYARRTRKRKKLLELTVLLALLGSVCVKAPWKMLVKLTPGQLM